MPSLMTEITPVAEQAMVSYATVHGSGLWDDISAKWNFIDNTWNDSVFYQMFSTLIVPEKSMSAFITPEQNMSELALPPIFS